MLTERERERERDFFFYDNADDTAFITSVFVHTDDKGRQVNTITKRNKIE